MRKLLTLFLILCLMLSLAACGAKQQNGGDTTNLPSSNTTTEQSGDQQEQPETNLTAFEKLFHERLYCVQAENGLYGYIDISGNYVVEPIFAEAAPFQNGLAKVTDTNTQLCGYIDATGNYAIEPKFQKGLSFSDNGLAAVLDASASMWGYIDQSGNYVIDPVYPEAKSFDDEGCAFVADFGGGWTMIDEKGRQIGTNTFSHIYDFSEDLAVVEANGMFGYINRSGEYVLEPCATDLTAFKNGRAFRSDGGGYAMIDKDMNLLTDAIYDLGNIATTGTNSKGYAKWSEGYCLVEVMGASGLSGVFLDENGNELAATGAGFIGLGDFSDGLAGACREPNDTLVGYIDINGNWVIEPQFVVAGSFYNGTAGAGAFDEGTYVQNNYIIDKTGAPIASFLGAEYYTIGIGDTRELMRVAPLVSEDSFKMGYMDRTGKLVIDAIFDWENIFTNSSIFVTDMSYARVQYNGLWGMIDRNGNWLIEAKFLKLVG